MSSTLASRLYRFTNRFRAAMLHVLATAAVFYVAVLLLTYALQRQMLFYPESYLPTPAESGVGDMQTVRFSTPDGLELFAWAKPPQAGKPWVAIFHGNAGTIAGRAYKARAFLDQGYGALLVEYRGYGGNSGSPSETGLMTDARAALAYLEGQGAQGASLVLYGESLGTGLAVAMAEEAASRGKPVAAVLLEAPYTTIPDVAAKHYPFLPTRLLMKDRFDSLSRIAGIRAPVFVIHGDQDWTVPQSLGKALFSAASEPKDGLWPEGAGHNDLADFGMFEAMLAFLRRHNI